MHLDRQMQLSFLHAILSDPEDDAPRLVYADWLDDHGDPLGELVRVQTEMRSGWLTRARRAELARRERELLAGFGFDRPGRTAQEVRDDQFTALPGGWNFAFLDGVPLLFVTSLYPSPALPPAEWVERFGWFLVRIGVYDSYEYRYELPEEAMRALLAWPLVDRCIGFDLDDVERAEGAVALLLASPVAPRLLRLQLRENETYLDALMQSPHLSGLLDLDVSERNALREEGAPASMPALRRLRMSGLGASSAALVALVRSPPSPELRSLDISGNDLDGEVVRALVEGPGLPNLVELDVSKSKGLTDEGALQLVRAPRLARLRRLGLSETPIGTPTVEALCAAPRLLRYGELQLWGCATTDESLDILARSAHAALLHSFVSGRNAYTDAGAKALAASPYLKGLRKLDLSLCQIGADGVEALTDPGAFPHLEELTLRGNRFGDRGALALAEWCRKRGAPALQLWRVGLTAAGVVGLARSGHLAGLRSLVLDNNAVGDEGVAALARCPDLASLRHLAIHDGGMTDAGAGLLLDSPHLSPELDLWASGASLSEEAKRRLRERFSGRYPSGL